MFESLRRAPSAPAYKRFPKNKAVGKRMWLSDTRGSYKHDRMSRVLDAAAYEARSQPRREDRAEQRQHVSDPRGAAAGGERPPARLLRAALPALLRAGPPGLPRLVWDPAVGFRKLMFLCFFQTLGP